MNDFWDQYAAYKASGQRDRLAVPLDGGSGEIYFTMATVRAKFLPTNSPSWNQEQWGQQVAALAEKHQLQTDFRDDSYVLTNQEGVYCARLRAEEFLFTPERFEEQRPLLQELVDLYIRPKA